MKKIKDLSNEAYHAHEAISKSKLDRVNRSIMHYLEPKNTEKSYFNFGSALHDSVLLPEHFENTYISMPESIKIRRGKEWDAFKESTTKTILTRDEISEVLILRDKILSHNICKNIFKDGEPEYSYFGEMEIDGVKVQTKCRPDYVSKDCLIDIKTTICGRYDDFKRAINKYRYHVQAAFYLDVVNQVMKNNDPAWIDIDTFIFVAVEKEAPYPIAVYMLDRESIDLGRKLYQEDLKTLVKYLKEPKPSLGYTDDVIQVIGCPNYAFYEEIS